MKRCDEENCTRTAIWCDSENQFWCEQHRHSLVIRIEETIREPMLNKCPCGSGEYPEQQYDGYGIFLCYTCSQCETKQMSKYRSDIHERYETDEQIEEDY